MKRNAPGWLWAGLLFLGCVAPIVALFVKPQNYAFYMFFPATPDTAGDRTRLAVANLLMVGGTVLAAIGAYAVFARARQRRSWLGLVAPLVVAAHPLLQPVLFESLDTWLNYRWYRQALEAGVMGRTPAEVRSLLGRPTNVVSIGSSETMWEYKPLWFYFGGSKGQVVFTEGRVTYVEPNDD